MITLAIDTATKTAGVALLRDETTLFEVFFNLSLHHSETVLASIQRGMSLAGIAMGEVDLFALTLGPGSFTGLRIGASTVKGLALATGKPVVGVSTLEALAYNAVEFPGCVCPVLDARKGEIYAALYRPGPDGLFEAQMEERATTAAELIPYITRDTLFLGDGLTVCADAVRERLRERAHFAAPNQHTVRASSVALLAGKKHACGDVLDTATFVPRYLRRSEAEVRGAGNDG